MFGEVLNERQTQKMFNIQFPKRVFLLNGKPINTNIMGKWFRQVVKGKKRVRKRKDGTKVVEYVGGTNIQDLRLYDLKHDRMTRERKRGATLSDLAEIAGQEDLRSTRRYAHQHLQTKRRIVNGFEPYKSRTVLVRFLMRQRISNS